MLIRARRREIPCLRKRATMVARPTMWSRPFGATICGKLDRAAWGVLLREREVTGRDASLPAPLLAAPLELVARATVGALPQTPQGAPPLDPARDRRKGTKSPLDPFFGARLGRASLLLLFRRFFCLFLRLFLLIQGFFPIKHLPHLPLRFLHHPVALLNRVLLRVVINLRPE